MLFALGYTNLGDPKIFDEDEVSGSPRPFPPKYKIPREIYFSLSEVGQCSTYLEVALLENPGHMKGDGATRVRVEPVLAFDSEDMVEVEDPPL